MNDGQSAVHIVTCCCNTRLLEELEEAAESVLATRQEIVDLDR